jgi:hypothetical protein
MSRRAARLAGLVAVTVAAGCGEASFSVPPVPVGVLTLFTRSVDGSYVARPRGLFAEAGSAPTGDSRSPVDTCDVGDYVPESTIPGLTRLDAGDSLVFVAGADTTILRPVNEFGVEVYLADPADVAFVPGTPVRFLIPGAGGGFPGTEIASATPAEITSVSPIPTQPSLSEALNLTWQPAGDDSSRFEVLMLYATPGAQNFDQQVVCDWRDDGTGTIRPELLSGWAASELQRIEIARYRTERRLIGDAVLYLLATFDTLVPVAP